MNFEEALDRFNSSFSGISEEEAGKRIKGWGKNKLKKKRSFKWAKIIFGQFKDTLVIILLVAAGLALFFQEYRDTTIIMIIVLVNAIIGFLQEFKAERTLEKMKKLTTDKALVMRDGKKIEISANFLVPGDVVSVTSGDKIPADGYILESYQLKINSVIFTGESKPKKREKGTILERNISLAEITNMVFMGETVSTGEAAFLVTGTGMNTELGKIADLSQEVKEEITPLQKKVRTLGKNVTVLAVLIGAMVMIAGHYFKLSLYDNFLFALALSVSVVPEGLPAAISVALSLGMKRLLGKNVLTKRLSAVETLGSVSIICTDKTGTITKNELTVTEVIVGKNSVNLGGIGYNPSGDFYQNEESIDPRSIPNLEMIFRIGTLCNSSNLSHHDGIWEILGDPTEGAMIVAGRKFNSKEDYYLQGEKKVFENPFSSSRMMMSVVYRGKKLLSYVKGSPDVLIDLCDTIQDREGVKEFTSEEKESAKELYNNLSSQALRVLAFAYRDMDGVDEGNYLQESERKLTWVGMMAMIDPPREKVREAISECKKLGIRVIMITGDYEITAQAIARKAGILENVNDAEEDLVIGGKMIEQMSDTDLFKKIMKGTSVFARITPEQKLRIAKILKDNGQIMAMTGDGVNDAPALKKADIGVAMGMMGTDVSKEVSDMILLDDNFSSIVNGVKEGRTIYQNIRKFVYYVFTSNASEFFAIVIGVVLHIPSPVTAVQILAIDLGTDVFPSFSLGLEPPEKRSVSKKERKSKNVIIDFNGFKRIVYNGIIMATGAVAAFLWSMIRGGWTFGAPIVGSDPLYIKSTAAAYAVLAMTQMANLLGARSEKLSVFEVGFFKNKYLIFSIFISFGILLCFLYVPFIQKYLHLSPIDSKDWMMVIGSMLAVFFFEEARKAESK